jgi:hypothetical protein
MAYRIHRLGYKFAPSEGSDILIRDASGKEIFSIAFEGGFVAAGPAEPYTAHSREYADDDDMTGTIFDW